MEVCFPMNIGGESRFANEIGHIAGNHVLSVLGNPIHGSIKSCNLLLLLSVVVVSLDLTLGTTGFAISG